jgi:hypothetical protein
MFCLHVARAVLRLVHGAGDDVTYVYDDVRYVYDDVTCVLSACATLRAWHRYASISVGLFCAYNRSLLSCGRPLLTLVHTHTLGMLVLIGLFCLIIGLF